MMKASDFQTLTALIERIKKSNNLPASEKEGYLALLSHIQKVGYLLTEDMESLDVLYQIKQAKKAEMIEYKKVDVTQGKINVKKAKIDYDIQKIATRLGFQGRNLSKDEAEIEASKDKDVVKLWEAYEKSQMDLAAIIATFEIKQEASEAATDRWRTARDNLQGRFGQATGG